MKCSELSGTILLFGEYGLVLLGATAYRIIIFMIFLSASIGPSILLSRLYDHITEWDPLPEVVVSMICMVLLRNWAKFSVTVENRMCGPIIQSYIINYPNLMVFGSNTVHFIIYICTFWNMYVQFHAAHTYSATPQHPHWPRSRYYPESDSDSDSAPEKHPESKLAVRISRNTNTAFFLLSLSYLVFTTTRCFRKIIVVVIKELPSSPLYSIFTNFLVRFVFMAIHLLINAACFVPCFALAYTSVQYKTVGHSLYFQLCFTAVLSGMIAGLFELNRPWPQSRGKLPYLYFENNVLSKDMLNVILIFPILYFFYRPLSHDKVKENEFDSGNQDVINFCTSVAFAVLHMVKFSVHAILALIQDSDNALQQRQYDQAIQPDDQEVVVVESCSGNPPNPNCPPPASLAFNTEVGPDGMCSRCTDNMLNNNQTYYRKTEESVPPTNNNSTVASKSCQRSTSEEGKFEIIYKAEAEINTADNEDASNDNLEVLENDKSVTVEIDVSPEILQDNKSVLVEIDLNSTPSQDSIV